PMRWNSSYLAWNQLLKLKGHIGLLKNLLSTKSDSDSKKDFKHLKKISLYDDEWDALQDLVEILEPCAEATNYLGGSNYCIYSIMVPTLLELKKRYQPSVANDDIVDKINYEDDENLFEDATIDEEEEVQTYTPISIDLDEVKSILYNAISHYWPDLTTPNSLLPCLLDPRCKSLTFVTFDEWFATENLLHEEYSVTE
ncbi:14984_t:CDS:1, partial [Racocetra persica]